MFNRPALVKAAWLAEVDGPRKMCSSAIYNTMAVKLKFQGAAKTLLKILVHIPITM